MCGDLTLGEILLLVGFVGAVVSLGSFITYKLFTRKDKKLILENNKT